MDYLILYIEGRGRSKKWRADSTAIVLSGQKTIKTLKVLWDEVGTARTGCPLPRPFDGFFGARQQAIYFWLRLMT